MIGDWIEVYLSIKMLLHSGPFETMGTATDLKRTLYKARPEFRIKSVVELIEAYVAHADESKMIFLMVTLEPLKLNVAQGVECGVGVMMDGCNGPMTSNKMLFCCKIVFEKTQKTGDVFNAGYERMIEMLIQSCIV